MARLSNSEHRSKSLSSILRAAEYLFVTRGYNATTTADIGKLAGLTKGAVYFYFSDKEAVLLELLAGVQEVVMMPLTRRLGDTRLLPSERISAFLEFGGSLSKETPGSMLLPIVVSIEFAGSNTVVENRVKTGYRKVRNGIREVLALGQELGEFRADVSADELSRALIATNDGLMLECLRNDLNVHVDRLVSTLNAVLLAGIAHSASAAQRSIRPFEPHETRSVIEVLRSRLPELKDKTRKATSAK